MADLFLEIITPERQFYIGPASWLSPPSTACTAYSRATSPL